VAGVLLAPVVDEHLLGSGHDVPADLQSRHPPRHQTAIGSRPGRGRAGVVPGRRGAADRGVVRIEHVDIRVAREVRRQRHPEQPTVPVVVDLAGQVCKGDRVRVGQALKDLDYAVLLADEDPPVGRELQHRRVGQTAQRDRVAKPSGQRRRPGWTRAYLGDERGAQPDRRCDHEPTPTRDIPNTPHAAPLPRAPH
jgi:hypothetical protein